MSIFRVFGMVGGASFLLLTAKNKAENPKASLTDSLPIVDAYKAIFAMYTRQMAGSMDDKGLHSTEKKPGFAHSDHVEPSTGLEGSGANPLEHGAYRDIHYKDPVTGETHREQAPPWSR